MEGDFPLYEAMEARLAKAEAELEARRRTQIDDAAASAAVEAPAPEAAREVDNWLLKSVSAGNVLAFEWDMITDRLIRSENAERFLGYAGAQISTGTAFFKMILPEDRTRLLRVLSGLRKRGGAYTEIYRLRLPDGSIIWVEDSSCADVADSGKPMRLNGVLIDITERKRAEADASRLLAETQQGQEALRQSEDRYESLEQAKRLLDALMEHVPEGITIADAPNGRIRMISRYGRDALGAQHDGMTAEEVISHWTVYQRDGITPMPVSDLPMTRVLTTGEAARNIEVVMANAKGQKMTLLCNAAPIRGANSEIVGSIVAWRDITELQQAGKALKQAHDELEHKLAERTEELQRVNRKLRAISDSNQALEQKNAQLRSLTCELSPPLLDQEGLAEALKWLCQQFRKQHQLNVQLTVAETPAIPDENLRAVVFRAVRELLFNIVKHANVKNALVRMETDKGDHLHIVVSDKGVGFDVSKVLTRCDATGGFGLFSMRERLELLGCGLDIQSEPGRGSSFTVRIPLGKPAAEPKLESAPASAPKTVIRGCGGAN